MTEILQAFSNFAGRMAATDDPVEHQEAGRRLSEELRRIERKTGVQVNGQRLESVRRLERASARG